MSRASEILSRDINENKPRTAKEVLDPDSIVESNLNEDKMQDLRIATGVTDAIARYRSTNKLEYRLNLILTVAAYAAAAGISDPAEKTRVLNVAHQMNREFGKLQELSDISNVVQDMYRKMK